jgi:uncharacterized sulfatase
MLSFARYLRPHPLTLLLCLTLLPAARVFSDSPPNVVMIISDDQAWGDYGFMGHPQIETPHLDRLAAESLTYTRGYVPDSLCRPSLATIISGRYPHQHGIVGNDPPRPAELVAAGQRSHTHPRYLPIRKRYIDKIDPVDTLPEMLAEQNYLSLQTGKWWEGNYRRGGFTHGMTHGDMRRGGRHGDAGLRIGRNGLEPIAEFLDTCAEQEKPFFIWYAPFLPHTPHNPPERLLEKYRSRTDSLPLAKYWAMCEWFDETCGELLGALDDRQLAQETIVLYVTDNGWINRLDASRYAPRSKRSPHEGGVRTPIMIRWPGQIEPRRDDTQLASSIDLVPTVLELVGQTVPADLPGINLTDRQAVADREAIFGEIFEHDIVSMDDPVASLQYRWVVVGNWKLIEPFDARLPDAEPELYNLAQDPHEQQNLAMDQPQRVEQLQSLLIQWWNPTP